MKNIIIKGKVAQILNEREIAINVGEIAGVEVGMKFKVLAKTPLEITDPDTNELLGSIDREKVRVLCSEVKDRISICRTYITKSYPGLFSSTRGLFGQVEDRVVIETLKTDETTFPPPLLEEDSFVKIGDRIESILDDEDE